MRPLTQLVTRLMQDPQDTGFQEVVDLLIQWRKWAPTSEVTQAWCAAAVHLGSFEPERIDDDLAALVTKADAAGTGLFERSRRQCRLDVLIEQEFELAAGSLAGRKAKLARVTLGGMALT